MAARIMLPLLCLVAVVPGAVTGQNEGDNLQGDWVQVAAESRGQKISDELVKKARLTIKGDQWMANYPGKDIPSTFRIDSSKEPKTIDLTQPMYPPARGIYKLDGDTLTVCYAVGVDAVRPKEFKTTNDFTGTLTVWKRADK